ncbi:MAG: hypothetical protein M4579_001311 [Chaenotheca gracillima]|nr:MAG: hypothetical protein M4579_001311 [Chaenotheca gracillima]
MDEEDDDLYDPAEPNGVGQFPEPQAAPVKTEAESSDSRRDGVDQKMEIEEEEGDEEEEDESDSDIDIITERKDGSKPEPPQQPAKYNNIRNLPARSSSMDAVGKPPPQIKADTPSRSTPAKSGADYPAVKTSNIDVDAKPIYEPAGKPLTQLDIDEDLKEHDKPWRLPGSDMTDYFNYGFDEFTWTLYSMKQDKTRAKVEEDKKEFNGMMMGLEGMPSMPGMPGAGNPQQAAPPAAMPSLPGMPDMPPEMQAMMAQMMASGMDPSQMAQMDPSMFQAAMGQPGSNNQGMGFNPNQQGFGGQGPQNQQQVGYGMDPSMMGGDGRNRQANFGGRGRGTNRRNW